MLKFFIGFCVFYRVVFVFCWVFKKEIVPKTPIYYTTYSRYTEHKNFFSKQIRKTQKLFVDNM